MIANVDHIQTPDELAEIGMPCVKWWTTRYVALTKRVDGIYPDDIESAATLGLLDAIQRYDPTKGSSFVTYCNIKIKYKIIDMLRVQQGTRGRKSVDQIKAFRKRVRLYDQCAPDRGSKPLLVIDNQCNDREETTADIDARLDMRSLFRDVSRQAALMLAMRYVEDMSFRDIAQILGVTDSRASQLHTKLKPLLRMRIQGRQEAPCQK